MTQHVEWNDVRPGFALPAEFRVDPALRRSCWHLMLVLLLVLAFRVGALLNFGQAGANPPANFWPKPVLWVDLVLLVVFSAGAVVVVILAHRWRIHIDVRGVGRRRLWRWDHWTWEAFQGGSVRKGLIPYSYYLAENRRGGRTLFLMPLDAEALEFARTVCRRLWVPPPREPVPKRITIGIPKRRPSRWVRIGCDGLFVRQGRIEASYRWDEVEVEVKRIDHDEVGFQQLRLKLPGKRIRLRKVLLERWSNWTGATSETIAALIQEYAPVERTRTTVFFGPPEHGKEVEERLRAVRRRLWWNRIQFCISSLPANLCAGFALWMGAHNLFLPLPLKFRLKTLAMWIAFAVVLWLVLGGVWWVIHRFATIVLRKESALLERYRSREEAVSVTEAPEP